MLRQQMARTLAHEIDQSLSTIADCLVAALSLLDEDGRGAQGLRDTLDLALAQAETAGALAGRMLETEQAREPRCEALQLASLTRRERQVLELVVAGQFNKTIAGVLGICTKTVELHRASLMSKLGVRNLPDLVRVYLGCR
jgi:DNA-binding NarL/FixJ family response regulator